MGKYSEKLGLSVSFHTANQLSASVPLVPGVDSRTVLLEKGSVHAEGVYPLHGIARDPACPASASRFWGGATW
jgi:hypothetical protein